MYEDFLNYIEERAFSEGYMQRMFDEIDKEVTSFNNLKRKQRVTNAALGAMDAGIAGWGARDLYRTYKGRGNAGKVIPAVMIAAGGLGTVGHINNELDGYFAPVNRKEYINLERSRLVRKKNVIRHKQKEAELLEQNLKDRGIL